MPVSEVRNTINNKIKKLKKQGFNPYFVPGGGHGNIGTQAYVNAYNEIVDYEKMKVYILTTYFILLEQELLRLDLFVAK